MARIDLEKIILLAFFALLLFLGPGILFGHKIQHDFPFAYSASDAFQHQVRAEAIKDAGNFRYEAAYISKGIENAVGRYPPVLYHLAVVMSYAAGIEVYDSIFFIVAFFAVIAAFIMYYIIKEFSRTVALLSLPLSILAFSFPPSLGFIWGHWPSLLSQSFLVLLFWSVMRIDMRHAYVLMALALSATALTHTSETVFAFMFLALFFGIKLAAKKLSKNDIKNIAFFMIIFFVVIGYYFIIFQNTWAKTQPYSFIIEPVWEGNPGFYIAGFGLLLVPMIAGMIFSMPRLKDLHVSIILAFAMLASGFLNYIGFGLRSFQIRFFWPIYLSVFLGFGLYMLLKLIIKKWNFIYTSVLFVILVILLAGIIKFPVMRQMPQTIPYVPYFNMDTNQGVMNPFHWSALKWLSENTPQDSRIYFFYGDTYNQDALLRNSKRLHYQVDPPDFIKAIQERKIKRSYVSELPGDTGGSIAVRKGLFSFEDEFAQKPKEYSFGPQDICEFGYLVFDKISGQQVLAQYNLLIASELLKRGYINAVFENEVVVILKNNNLGVDCIEERNF